MKKKTVLKAATIIYNARLKKGYTQLELGRMLGHNYGNFIAPIKMIPQLSNLLDLDPKILLREVMICRYPTVVKFM